MALLLKKNLWFWKAALDHTLTYFYGETTIPTYGKIEETSNSYLLQIAMQRSFAELFLKNIESLKTYSKELKNSKNLIKKRILSYKYLNQISNKTIALADKIQVLRENLDSLYELLINAKQPYFIEQEFEKSPDYNSDTHKSKLDSAQKNFDTYLESIIAKFDECIKLFDDKNLSIKKMKKHLPM